MHRNQKNHCEKFTINLFLFVFIVKNKNLWGTAKVCFILLAMKSKKSLHNLRKSTILYIRYVFCVDKRSGLDFPAFQRTGGWCKPGRNRTFPLLEQPAMSWRVCPLSHRMRGREFLDNLGGNAESFRPIIGDGRIFYF